MISAGGAACHGKDAIVQHDEALKNEALKYAPNWAALNEAREAAASRRPDWTFPNRTLATGSSVKTRHFF